MNGFMSALFIVPRSHLPSLREWSVNGLGHGVRAATDSRGPGAEGVELHAVLSSLTV
jgi:hypothetical protein